jgi:hypothetical protein
MLWDIVFYAAVSIFTVIGIFLWLWAWLQDRQ